MKRIAESSLKKNSKMGSHVSCLPCTLFLVMTVLSLLHSPLPAAVHGADKPRKIQKVGLTLSGGGARGIAHIGVLIALEEEGIPIDLLTGTSMGSIVGGLYAAGYSGKDLRRLVNEINWKAIFSQSPEPGTVWVSQRYGMMQPILRLHFRFWKLSIPFGLINGQRISQELFKLAAPASFAARSDFDSLRIPYRAMAVDISRVKVYALHRGSLPQAMRASMAIPLVFYPALYHRRMMVDGGVMDVLPTDIARKMGADIVIGVDVTEMFPKNEIPDNIFAVGIHTIDIMVKAQEDRNIKYANVMITPKLGHHSDMNYTGLDSLIEIGYRATKAKMKEIKKLVYDRGKSAVQDQRKLDLGELKRSKISAIRVIGHRISGVDSIITYSDSSDLDRFYNQLSRKGVVVSYFPLKAGERFDMDRALKGVENLYATGLFQNVWLELDNVDNERVRVNIHFLEEATRTIGMGVNYFNEEGISVFAQVVPFTFLGLGARFMPLFRYGKLQKRTGLEIANSRFMATSLIFNNGSYYEADSPYIYDEKGRRVGQLDFRRVIGHLSFGLQPFREYLFTVGLRGERIWLARSDFFDQPAVTYQHWSVFGQMLWDNTDNPHFPGKGAFFSLQAERVLNYQLKGEQFTKIRARLNWTQSILWGQKFTPFALVGLSEKRLPLYEKFYLGGPLTIPGYHRNEIWADNMIIGGLRYRLNFYKKLYGEASWSTASVFEAREDIKISRLINGIAIGLVLDSPVGPVSLLYGWNNRERRELYFSAGYNF